MASPDPTVLINGLTAVGGQNVATPSTVTFQLASLAGVKTWSFTCIGTDELNVASTQTAALTINSTTQTATLAAPAIGSALIFQSLVNGGLDVNGVAQAAYRTTLAIYTLTSGGLRVGAVNETTEGSAAFGWLPKFNQSARSAGITASLTVDGASANVAIQDCVTVTGTGTVTRATLSALGLTGGVLGVATSAGVPGAQVQIQLDGLLTPAVSGVASFGPVRCNTTTARCEVVASFALGDYPVGTSNAQGYVIMARSVIQGLAAWTPASLSGLSLWLRPDLGVTSVGGNGTAITQIVDQSGLGNTANPTTTARPTLNTADTNFNGKASMRFDGVANVLTSTLALGATTASVYIVARRISAATSNATLMSLVKSAQANDFDNLGSLVGFFEGTTNVVLQTYRNGALSSVTHPGNGVTFCASTILDGTNDTVKMNSTTGTPTGTTAALATANYYIGAGWRGSATSLFSNYDIAEVFIVNGVTSAGDKTNISAYMLSRYGITF